MTSLDAFKNGNVSLLVCSDVAARGLDIPAVSHVFNFDVPTHAEDYVHRIGRTARAGLSGTAMSIVTSTDRKYVEEIEKLIQRKIDWFGDDLASVSDAPSGTDFEATSRGSRDRRPSRRTDTRAPASTERRDAEPAARGESMARERAPRPEPIRAGGPRPTSSATGRSRYDEPRLAAAPSSHSRRLRRDDDDDMAVVGLGDHVPSFLLRPVKIKQVS